MAQHDEHAVVRAALIADPACGVVAQAALELAGITTDLGPPAPMWEALASGRVARVVCVGPEASDHWVRAGRPAPDRIVWVPRGYDVDVPDMASILERLGGAGRGAPRARWAPDGAAGIDPADLLGALLTLRPTLKVVVQRAEGALGLCLVRGRVIAAAVEGRRIAADEAVRRDRSLALVLDTWEESTPALDPIQAMYADLAFTCDYDHLFGPSAGFAQHATSALVELLAHPIQGLVFEPHAPSEQGPPLSEVALRALVALPEAARQRILGEGPFHALGTIPKWLRGTLPPERFGRIFFVLAEGVHLRDLPRMRLAPAELEAAVILGTLTGIARRPGPPVFAPPRKTPALGTGLGAALGATLGQALGYAEHMPPTPVPAVTPGTPSVRPRRITGETPRVKAATLPMGSPDVVVAVNPPVCGSSEGFFAMLGALAAQGRGERRRARLAGTRLEPLGEVVGDLLVYYGIGASESTRAMLGVMARGEHAGRILVGQRPARGGDSFDDRHGGGAEARLLRALAHPHIVKGLGDVETPAGHVLLTEHVHGVTLAELVTTLQRRDEPLPDAVLVYIGVSLARALQHVHDLRASDGRPLGLVHGDVNPSNVLLGFGGDVKLMGFSHARYRSEAARSRRGPRLGRIGYMSPESLIAAPGPRADVYGLGACLYELVTGRRPIQAETPADTLEAVILGDHVPLLELAPLLPPRFVYVIERAIASKPAERFRTAEAFGRALGRGAALDAGAVALVALLDHLFGMLAAREIEAMFRMERRRPADVLRESALGAAELR